MHRYKVLWIDDQPSEEFMNEAAEYNIDIELATCHDDGVKLLEDKSNYWDAIILDANCKISNDKFESPSLESLQESISYILQFCSKDRFIPWFVYTAGGYEGFEFLGNSISKNRIWDNRKYYKKPSERLELYANLKKASDTQIETQIRHEYHKVFSVFSNNFGGENELLEILMSLKGYKEINEKTYYTQLRLILEWMFRDANKKGLLHDKCIYNNSKVNLTESSLFLAGKQTKYLGVFCAIAHFPKIIADNIKTLLEITGGASHTSKPEESELVNLHTYWKQVNTPYLLYSLTFMLCDILIWYKDYISQNSDININKSHWRNIPQSNILTGKITNFSSTGLAFLKPNGSVDSKENCSIKPECCLCQNIHLGETLTIEYTIKQNKSGENIRTSTRILRKEE